MFVLNFIGIAMLCYCIFICIMLGLVYCALRDFDETEDGL